jgi:nucleoside-diphosphate-sugar epimerase
LLHSGLTDGLEKSGGSKRKVVIVGAGLGGCVCAFSLSHTHDVTVIELGKSTSELEERVVDLARPAGGSPHVGSGLGGGTALWHNALIEIDEEIFEQYWPFAKAELEKWYDLAYPLLGGTRKEALSGPSETLRQEYRKMGLEADLYQSQFIPSSRRNLWHSLGLTDRVRLVRGEAIRFGASGEHIDSVTVRTAGGEVEVAGDYFVLAGGGFGTPVLLERMSQQLDVPSLQNAGRFYEDHPIGFIGRVQIRKPIYRFWNYSVPGGSLRALTVVRHEGGHFGFQLRPAALRLREDRSHRIGSIITKLRNQIWNPLHWFRLLMYWDDVLDILSMKFRIRIPTSHYAIFLQAGQHPSEERSVFADGSGDVPKKIYRKWVLSPEYFATVRAAIDSFSARILPFSNSLTLLPNWQDALATGAHHSGTARMSHDPKSGVCDANGKIHGLENVYIADGSCIPCSGVANTGLTIGALALRLADHIEKNVRGGAAGAEPHIAEVDMASEEAGLCLVTGATGFIGTRFCTRVQWAGNRRLRVLARSAEKGSSIAGPFVEVIQGDLLDPRTIDKALEGCDTVVHLAHGDDNVAAKATRNLVEAAVGAGIKRFVHVSSIAVHGPEPGPEAAHEATARIGRYGESYCDAKAEEEEIVRNAIESGRLPAVILRPTIVYGPGGSFVESILKDARHGRVSLVDEGSGVCNAVYIDDVCDAIEAALTNPNALGSAVFINGDRAVSWREFALAFASLVQPSPVVEDLRSGDAIAWWAKNPPRPVKTARSFPAKVARKIIRTVLPKPATAPYPPLGRIQREIVRVEFANSEAKRVLGWAPKVDFAAGVERIKKWLENGAEPSGS